MESNEMLVKVRYVGGTYLAWCNGQRSSCTASAETAACKAAAKAFRVPDGQVKVIRDNIYSSVHAEYFIASRVN